MKQAAQQAYQDHLNRQAIEVEEAEHATWHARFGRCGRPVAQCTCFTTADMYQINPDGTCSSIDDVDY